MRDWVGLGPSAASQHAGWRGANVADLARWQAGLDRGQRMTEDRVEVTPELRAEDALIFGLRMNEGVDVASWRARAPAAPWAAVERVLSALAEEGLLTRTGDRVVLTHRGRMMADAVGGEVMEAFDLVPEAV